MGCSDSERGEEKRMKKDLLPSRIYSEEHNIPTLSERKSNFQLMSLSDFVISTMRAFEYLTALAPI